MPKQNTWSVKSIQDMPEVREDRERKNIYASDYGKCPGAIYYSLLGYKPSAPITPESLRRMQVGKYIEDAQVKKLQRLGIYLGGNDMRFFDETYNVSGKPDAIIINPNHCSKKAKELITYKTVLHTRLSQLYRNMNKGLGKYHSNEITETAFLEGKAIIDIQLHNLYKDMKEANDALLVPDKQNELMLVEIKSINESGIKYRVEENGPDEHYRAQTMFYLWKLREKYPNVVARVLYVTVPYQELYEYDIDYNESDIDRLKAFWTLLNNAIKSKTPPEPAPAVILNSKTGRWQLNWQAEYCGFHDHCTQDPAWKAKAWDEVKRRNAGEMPQPKKLTAKKPSATLVKRSITRANKAKK